LFVLLENQLQGKAHAIFASDFAIIEINSAVNEVPGKRRRYLDRALPALYLFLFMVAQKGGVQ
jgi:hypothetical protein